MTTQHIYTNADNLSVDCVGTTNINSHDGVSAGLMLGGVLCTFTASEANRILDVSSRLVNVTASTLVLAAASHEGHIVTLNRAAGIAVTLPAATGTGAEYTLVIGTTITSNTTTITAAGSDKLIGFDTIVKSGTTTPNVYPITATSTILTLDGITQGGFKGDIIKLIDLAANLWLVTETLQGSGAITSNFT